MGSKLGYVLIVGLVIVVALAIVPSSGPAATPSVSSPHGAACKCVANEYYTNNCTCGITVLSINSNSAPCSAPPECADIQQKCNATFMFAFVGHCGNDQYTLDAIAVCEGGAISYKRCPGATTAIALHLECGECTEIPQ